MRNSDTPYMIWLTFWIIFLIIWGITKIGFFGVIAILAILFFILKSIIEELGKPPNKKRITYKVPKRKKEIDWVSHIIHFVLSVIAIVLIIYIPISIGWVRVIMVFLFFTILLDWIGLNEEKR